MKGRKHKILADSNSYPNMTSTECEKYWGAQTFIDIIENNLVEVTLTESTLMEEIFSDTNLNLAYKQIMRNKGAGGVDKMGVDELLPYLRANKDELLSSLFNGKYTPNPVRRVEIPKGNGKLRPLGIPTVVDRLIQQAITQVLTRIYNHRFSNWSYGFRPQRGCHDALRKVQDHVNQGYKYAVDLDLEKFFDTVNHSILIRLLSKTIKDNRIISLIHKYLNAGVLKQGVFTRTTTGVPQGGNLSPILSNIILNELDKELARRGHKFVRYADDCMILLKSKKSAERVMHSITRFIESKLRLKVNKEKTKFGYIRGMKFLGYSFYVKNGKCRLGLHKTSLQKMKSKLKEITSRSNGMGYKTRKRTLKQYIQGWINYYCLADMKSTLKRIDEWLRRRLRMCMWKYWKKIKTKFENLIKCGIDKQKSWEWANTRKSYWRTAKSPILHRAITANKMRQAGYTFLSDCYSKYYRN
ncbi:MAG: group II intron reverse transcriptase/maturase [Eubacteriales bacterium]